MIHIRLLHPLILAVYPILLIFSENFDQLKFSDLLGPIAVSTGVSIGVIIFFSLIYRRLENACLLASAWLFLFYSFAAFEKALHSLTDSWSYYEPFFTVFWGFIFVSMPFLLRNRNQDLKNATAFLNVVGLALMLMQGFNLANSAVAESQFSAKTAAVNPEPSQTRAASRPDIFLIILDGYARQDILKDLYNHDNQQFVSFLKEKGFHVIEKAQSNYCQTLLSMASLLNYQNLDEMWQKTYQHNSLTPLNRMIAENRLFAFLKNQGYRTIAFESGYSGTEMKRADLYIARSLLNTEFINILINTTYLAKFKTDFFDVTQTQIEAHRERIKQTFDGIARISGTSENPVMVFAHLAAPHPPFVFDESGNLPPYSGTFSLEDGSHWENPAQNYKKSYVNQLKFVNKKTMKLVEKMLADSQREKVIIIQADHGPGSELDWKNFENTNVRERMSILNAIYFPDGNYGSIRPDHTPFNTFRVVLNRYFNENLELLENRSFFSRWIGRYMFIEVTEKLRQN
ncbi:MAG: sulfatase-like hydrolase/transferase [Candidatus Rifleibacteriota bacterium]